MSCGHNLPMPTQPPSRHQVEEQFIALSRNTADRDLVDRWAARWVVDDVPIDDGPVEWALGLLHGIDLRHGGPESPYLHDATQISGWLDEFRRRCAGSPDPRLSAER